MGLPLYYYISASVALVNDLICIGNLEGAASRRACRLLVCYVIIFYESYLYDLF